MAESHRDEIAKLESMYAANPEGRVFTHLAEALRKAGEFARAREVVEEGLRRHDDSASGYVVLGRVLQDLGHGDESATAFRRVLELDPENRVALRALGDLARERGQSQEALAHYRQLLALDPSDEDLETLVADLAAPPAAQPQGDPLQFGTWDAPAAQEPAVSMPPEVRPPAETPSVFASDVPGLAADEGSAAGAGSGASAGPGEAPFALVDEFGSLDLGPSSSIEEFLNGVPDVSAPVDTEPAGEAPPAAEPAAAADEPLIPYDVAAAPDEAAPPELGTPGPALAQAGDAPSAGEPEPAYPEGPPWGLEPTLDDAVIDYEHAAPTEMVTETMAELYRSQGHLARAADVYRALLRQRPGDEYLERQLLEIELAMLSPEGAPPATEPVETAELAEQAGLAEATGPAEAPLTDTDAWAAEADAGEEAWTAEPRPTDEVGPAQVGPEDRAGGEQPAPESAWQVEPEAPVEPGDFAELAASAELAEPIELAEPGELLAAADVASGEGEEAAEYVEPFEAEQAAEPAEYGEPAQYGEYTEPAVDAEHAERVEAEQIAEPAESAEPVEYAEPIEAEEPPGPVEPAWYGEPEEAAAEAESTLGGVPVEADEPGAVPAMEAVWGGGGELARHHDTPYAWESGPPEEESGPPISAYLQALLAWRGREPAEPAPPDVAEPYAASPEVEYPAVPAEPEAVAPPAAAAEEWLEATPVFEAPTEEPWAETPTEAPGRTWADEAADEPWATGPAIGPDEAAAAAEDAEAAGDDNMAWLLGPDGVAPERDETGESSADVPDAPADDDDLEMFRAWLQSLKK